MKTIGLVPELLVGNLNKSLSFYVEILDFKIKVGAAEEDFVHLQRLNAEVMLEKINGRWHNWINGELQYPLGRGINLRIEVDDADAIFRKLLKNNFSIFIPMEEKWYKHGKTESGNKQFGVLDPDGYLLRIYQDLGERNA